MATCLRVSSHYNKAPFYSMLFKKLEFCRIIIFYFPRRKLGERSFYQFLQIKLFNKGMG